MSGRTGSRGVVMKRKKGGEDDDFDVFGGPGQDTLAAPTLTSMRFDLCSSEPGSIECSASNPDEGRSMTAKVLSPSRQRLRAVKKQ